MSCAAHRLGRRPLPLRVRNVRLQAKYSSLLQVIPALGQVGVLALGGWLAVNGEISSARSSPSRCISCSCSRPSACSPGSSRCRRRRVPRRSGSSRSSTPTRSSPSAPTRATSTSSPVRWWSTTSYGYLASEPVLQDFSLLVAPGETVALVGASGSGKSTVSLLLPRFYDVQQGTIRIDGIDVRDVTLDSLRREVGVVFEDSFLFSDTVRNNIAYGRPHATDAEVERRRGRGRTTSCRAARRLRHRGRRTGAHALGRPAPTDRHRAAVLTDPRVLVLDDATSSIDARTEEQIHATLRDVTEHRTTIVIAHRRSTLRLADRIVVVEHGRGREGTLDELTATSPRFRTPCSPGPTTSMARATRSPSPMATGPTLRSRRGSGCATRVPEPRCGRSCPSVTRAGGSRVPAWAAAEGAVAAAARAGAGAAGRSRPRRSCRPRIAGLPPADDEPHVDTAAEAAGSETFRLRDFLRPYRRPLLVGFGLVAFDALLMLLGPLFVRQGINEGVLEGSRPARGAHRRALFLATTLVDWLLTWTYTRYTGRTAERLLLRAAHPYLRPSAAARARFLRPRDGGAGHDPHDHRRRHAVEPVADRARHRAGQRVDFVGVLVVLTIMSPQLTLAVLDHAAAPVPHGVVPAAICKAHTHARGAISNVNAEFQENLSGIASRPGLRA